MAFSTQKEVLKIGFLNEVLDPTCLRKAGVILKTYPSSTDVRALDFRRQQNAHYIADLVACRTYGDLSPRTDLEIEDDGTGRGRGMGRRREGDLEIGRVGGAVGVGDKAGTGDKSGVGEGATGVVGLTGKGRGTDGKAGEGFGGDLTGGPGGFGSLSSNAGLLGIPQQDSLIFQTTEKLKHIDEIVQENEKLKDELACSAGEFKRIADENEKLKGLVKSGDPTKIDEFEKKIRDLKNSGKVNPEDLDELLNLRKQIGDRQKAIEAIEAENNALKKLTEKLSARANIPEVSIEKETRTDVPSLQETVNKLKQEVAVLRSMENKFVNAKVDFDSMKKKYESMSEKQKEDFMSKDAEHVKAIVDERNKLREQLAKMVGLEGKIAKLREKALKADEMEKQFEGAKNASQFAADTLKDCKNLASENEELKKQLGSTECLRNNLKRLENENSCLRNRLNNDQQKIKDYEYQIDKLITVIQGLQCALMSKMSGPQAAQNNSSIKSKKVKIGRAIKH